MSLATDSSLPAPVPFPLNPSVVTGIVPPIPGGGGGGSPVNVEVGPQGHWDIGIAGIGLNLDYRVGASGGLYGQIPYRVGYQQQRKQQFDTSKEPGEYSLTDDFWRRSRSSWHAGAGQVWLDADTESETSSTLRFRQSFGVDVWTKHELSLLDTVEQKKVGVASGSGLMTAYDSVGAAYLYFFTSSSLFYSANPSASPPSWSAVTGQTGAIGAVTSGGGYVYFTDTVGLRKIAVATSGASSAVVSGPTGKVGFANGFLFAAADPALYLISTAGAKTDVTPAFISTATGGNFTWVGFCDGPTGPIVAGRSGEQSIVFRGILDGNGALDHFEVACILPDGDELYSVVSYLNTILVMGLLTGMRLGQFDSSGVTYGRLFASEVNSVFALECQDRFCWFAYPNFDASDGSSKLSLSTASSSISGLGRMDLSTFTDLLVPAYATDLMVGVDGSNGVTGIATVGQRRYFCFNGSFGVYGETATPVSSGALVTGNIRWSTLEPKHLRFVDIYHAPLTLGDSVTVEVATDDGSFVTLGSSSTAGDVTKRLGLSESGRWFDARVTLEGDPTVTGWTAKAIPIPQPYRFFEVVVLMYDEVMPRNSTLKVGYQGYALYLLRQLQALRDTATPIIFQGQDYGIRIDDTVSSTVYTCVIDDITFEQVAPGGTDVGGFGGRCRLMLREVG